MVRRRSTAIAAVLAVALMVSACSMEIDGHDGCTGACGDERLNSVLWAQTAAEYAMVCGQSYALARLMLDEALADPSWTAALEQSGAYEDLPPAIILDVDETVLDNAAFDARLIRAGLDYDSGLWKTWVAEERAPALEGAAEFLEYAASRGVEIFYVTNRKEVSREATARNIAAVGLPSGDPEHVLCRNGREDWGRDKTTRRGYVAEGHRVLLLLGDNLNDFVSGGAVPPAERVELASKHRDMWGRGWITLPNSIYGQWDDALSGFDDDLPKDEKNLKRMAHLETLE